MDLYDIARPILFQLEAERAHQVGLWLIHLLRERRYSAPGLRVKTSFGELSNPLGLSAGYDKTGEHLSALSRLGFGYLVAGTFTLDRWPGHPKPRVVRNMDERSLVNSLGFPNPGVEAFIRNLASDPPKVPVVGSISGREVGEITECYRRIQTAVAAVELNLSSPNTPRLRDLRELALFKELANALMGAKRKPTFLKTPPYTADERFAEVLKMVKVWEDIGFEGVTASNTIPVTEPRLSIGTGGYSGPSLFPNTVKAVKRIREVVSQGFEVNATGGISNADNFNEVMSCGATTAQVFTALVYSGPRLVPDVLGQRP
ncbi:MAG: hypothetical protein LYZ66_01540 [Nitrososphaerales archaeon]|nr:hypothetical protein [Nitrososphaerales archaeon]